MEEREYLIELFLIYKNLLSTKEIKYFENYYFEDLSFTEIGENLGVSKSLVGKTINNINSKLNEFENKLNFLKVYEEIDKIQDDKIKNNLQNIIK